MGGGDTETWLEAEMQINNCVRLTFQLTTELYLTILHTICHVYSIVPIHLYVKLATLCS